MRKRFLTTLIVLLLIACDNSDPKDIPLSKISHENGLTLSIPANLIAKKTKDGYIIYPSNGLDYRSPLQFTISYSPGKTPRGHWQTKQTSKATLHYRQTSQSGGSGGTENKLIAWKNCVDGYIRTEQLTQLEYGDPNFSLSWQTITNANRNRSK